MSITWLSSKRFTHTQKYVQIYTVQDISNHINTTSSTSIHPFNSQTVQKRRFSNQEKRSLKRCFQIFLERGEIWRVADFCRKRVPNLSCLKVERFVSSRFEVSLGDLTVFRCWTEEFERVGRCDSVLKGTEEENSQSAWKLVWQFCSGCGPQRGASVVFPEGE